MMELIERLNVAIGYIEEHFGWPDGHTAYGHPGPSYLNPDPQNAKYEVWVPVVKERA